MSKYPPIPRKMRAAGWRYGSTYTITLHWFGRSPASLCGLHRAMPANGLHPYLRAMRHQKPAVCNLCAAALGEKAKA